MKVLNGNGAQVFLTDAASAAADVKSEVATIKEAVGTLLDKLLALKFKFAKNAEVKATIQRMQGAAGMVSVLANGMASEVSLAESYEADLEAEFTAGLEAALASTAALVTG